MRRAAARLLLDDLCALHNLAPERLDDFLPVPGSDLRIAKYPASKPPGLRRVVRGFLLSVTSARLVSTGRALLRQIDSEHSERFCAERRVDQRLHLC